MKKNFLKVAALLIAAMLMVVSCSQEVAPKTENNGLVEARLNVAYGRDLTVSGDTKQDGVTLKYAMYPQWNIENANEQIYGKSEGTIDNPSYKELKNGNLGYVTPGLWKVFVVAYGHDDGENPSVNSKIIFSGDTDVYFNETTKSATIFLSPVVSTKNTITFNFKMQALSGTMTGETPDYVLEYKLFKDGDSFTTGSGSSISCSKVVNNVCTFETSVDNVSSGFYRVNVSIYRKPKDENGSYVKENGEDKMILVGGTTKGFLVSGGANVVIGGNIEPSDYEKVSIDAKYVYVDTAFNEASTINYYKGKTSQTAEGGYDPNYAEITVSITDSSKETNNLNVSNNYTKTNYWTITSDGVTTTSQNNLDSVTFEVTSGGYKNISCTTIYTINDSANKTYYFAKTVTKQVLVSSESIEEAVNQKQ